MQTEQRVVPAGKAGAGGAPAINPHTVLSACPYPAAFPPPSLCLPCPSSQGKLAAHLQAGMDRRFLREAPTAARGWESPCSFPLGGGIPTSFQNFAEFYSHTS